MTTERPVAPDSVHVWRGFKAPGKDWVEFAEFLGQVFLPTGSLLQPGAGLHAFVPSMPDPKDKPATIPDQTALMFWTNQQAYHDGFKTVAVRAYTNLHGGAYGPPSSAQFPIALEDSLKSGQPYFLINKRADWMLGRVRHILAEPKNSAEFIDDLFQWAKRIQQDPPKEAKGALVCAGDNYIAAWMAWDNEVPEADPFNELTEFAKPYLNTTAETYELPAGLWDEWSGIDLTQGESSLNIQLKRPTQ